MRSGVKKQTLGPSRDWDAAQASAYLSQDERYRYWLSRIWDPGKPTLGFVMLNPSTADAFVDDPTIRRCVQFARDWGHGRLIVTNLFAMRATNPRELTTGDLEPIGAENDSYLLDAALICDTLVYAWGNHGTLEGRGAAVVELLRHRLKSLGQEPWCLGLTKKNQPRHPLYLSRLAMITPYYEELP
jgi:hypothetical protein